MNLVLPFLRPPGGEPTDEPADEALELAPPVRLTRHRVTLPGGHRVGVAVGGRGVPFVIVHGFGVESLLYAQPLSRLAALGFQIVAVDAGGHGDTQQPRGVPSLADYVTLLSETLDALGIRRCVLAGHSMGGRLVAEVAAARPELAIGVVLIDAIVGDGWERVVGAMRRVPPAMLGYGAALAFDTVASVPVLHDLRQTLKLGSRISRSVNLQIVRPWRGVLPGRAILLAPSSVETLDRLRGARTAVVAVHGEHDVLVPLQAARDAAARTGGDRVVVRGGSHSWLLRCPETLPAIVGELLDGPLGAACEEALHAEGIDPATAVVEEIGAACTCPGGLAAALGVALEDVALPTARCRPRFEWTLERQSRSTTNGA